MESWSTQEWVYKCSPWALENSPCPNIFLFMEIFWTVFKLRPMWKVTESGLWTRENVYQKATGRRTNTSIDAWQTTQTELLYYKEYSMWKKWALSIDDQWWFYMKSIKLIQKDPGFLFSPKLLMLNSDGNQIVKPPQYFCFNWDQFSTNSINSFSKLGLSQFSPLYSNHHPTFFTSNACVSFSFIQGELNLIQEKDCNTSVK